MPKSFVKPVPDYCVITQTWEEHRARAIKNGWAWKPGMSSVRGWYYPGVDLAPTWGHQGEVPVYAAADGKVTVAGPDYTDLSKGYGVHVRIGHPDGELTIYGHLVQGSLLVKAGDQVKAGQRIGTMGTTGNSTGVHLHWEWRRNGIPCDPWPLIIKAAPSPQPEPEPEPPTAVVAIPPLPKVKVLASPSLFIRDSADTGGGKVGSLQTGEEVEVIGVEKVGADLWLRIGYRQYIAMKFAGDTLAKWV